MEAAALSHGARSRGNDAVMRERAQPIARPVRKGLSARAERRTAALLRIAGTARQRRAVAGPDLAIRAWLRSRTGVERGRGAGECIPGFAGAGGDACVIDAASGEALIGGHAIGRAFARPVALPALRVAIVKL